MRSPVICLNFLNFALCHIRPWRVLPRRQPGAARFSLIFLNFARTPLKTHDPNIVWGMRHSAGFLIPPFRVNFVNFDRISP
jgi:hypothetical protein